MSEKHVIWVQLLVSAPIRPYCIRAQGKLIEMNCYVYVHKCVDRSYYTGITSNKERRLFEHNHHIRSSLQNSKLPVQMVYCEVHRSRVDAARREKEIKGWSRLKKEKLITQNVY